MKNITFHINDHFVQDDITSHIIGFEENEKHSHEFIEFFYVMQGTCIHNINGKTEKVKTGDARLLIPTDEHQFIFSNDCKNFLHRDIIFSFDFFKSVCDSYSEKTYNEILNNEYSLNLTMTNEEISTIESIIPNIIINEDQEIFNVTSKVICKIILNSIIEKKLQKTRPYPQWLTKLIYIMEAPENASKKLQTFLDDIPLSISHISHEFKKYMGKSMTEYFNEKKIKYAYSLLRTTNDSIENICFAIGFNNISHFYSLFKKYYGITPNRIRINN